MKFMRYSRIYFIRP